MKSKTLVLQAGKGLYGLFRLWLKKSYYFEDNKYKSNEKRTIGARMEERRAKKVLALVD
ncbi:hypothetical protein X474_08430 [Dethiosulfatarculus sandiegensis]|uniref:Uncharacterized protein n=1 Tax=Dethiosulfatarculus sandiegensis TaxID=1429043 RepID=A0A0D2JG22_9BACT|nr:hypothetical protein X474_08430 [Dethiosulfatarculus sandiegensis]